MILDTIKGNTSGIEGITMIINLIHLNPQQGDQIDQQKHIHDPGNIAYGYRFPGEQNRANDL